MKNPAHVIWDFATSVGGSALLVGLALGATAGALLGDLRNTLLAITILTALALGVAVGHSLWGANRKVDQILDEELDPRPDFAEDLIPVNHAPTTYDLTVGWHNSTDEPAIYRGLTRTELISRLAEHDVTPQAIDIGGRHTRNGGLQLTWGPSTTDTTGETR